MPVLGRAATAADIPDRRRPGTDVSARDGRLTTQALSRGIVVITTGGTAIGAIRACAH